MWIEFSKKVVIRITKIIRLLKRPYVESVLEKQDDKVLGSYSKEEQHIVQVTQPSCSPNVFEKVCLASDLPIFRFGCNFIVDASIGKFS